MQGNVNIILKNSKNSRGYLKKFVSKQAVTTDTRSVIGQTKILHAKKKIRSLLCHKTL